MALFVTSGLSGSGKSAGAAMIVDATGAKLLRTDLVRQGLPEDQRAARKTPEGILAVYVAMTDYARALLGSGKEVVLDGTFLRQEHRDLASGLAAEFQIRLKLFVFECPDDIAEPRILQRAAEGNDPSEAGVEVRRLQKTLWQPPVGDYIRIDTSGTLEDVRIQVIRALET